MWRERKPKSKARCLASAISWVFAVAMWFLLVVILLVYMFESFSVNAVILAVITVAAAIGSIFCCKSSWQQWKNFEPPEPESDKQEEDDHE